MKMISAEDIAYKKLKEYTHYVTTNRVLPYIDGCKPVQRRLLWSMFEVGARKDLFKSSNIVGHTLKYHPHGEASIYGAMVNMVGKSNPLILGKGNWGNGLYEPGFAAMRYTEARTSDIFEEILDSDFPNLSSLVVSYDEKNKEPLCIDTKIPMANLLGVSGIGVGLVTNYPAVSFDTIRDKILYAIDGNPYEKPDEFSCGCWEYEGSIYPEYSLKNRDGKIWLNISRIPNNKYLGSIQENKLIRELCACGQVLIEDKSRGKNKVDFNIFGPARIYRLIIKLLKKQVPNNFSYYHGKLRVSDYYEEWVSYRLAYMKRKLYYNQMKEFNKALLEKTLSEAHRHIENVNISGKEGFQKLITEVSEEYYNEYRNILSPHEENCMEWIKTSKEEYTSYIKSKSLSSFKNYSTKDLSFVSYSNDDIKNKIVEEIESINKSIFSKPSKKVTSLPRLAEVDDFLNRYVTHRGWNQIVVSFRQIPRMTNWLTDGDILVIYEDGSTKKLRSDFFGTFTDDDKKIVGFTFPDKPTVFVTESGSVMVYKRFSKVNEIIKHAFTAQTVLINGKKYKANGGQSWSNVESWAIGDI